MGIHCTYCKTNDHGVHHLKERNYVTTTQWLPINRRTADGQIYYWLCFDRTCGGRAVTDINDFLVSANNHAQSRSETMKERSKTETTPIPREKRTVKDKFVNGNYTFSQYVIHIIFEFRRNITFDKNLDELGINRSY